MTAASLNWSLYRAPAKIQGQNKGTNRGGRNCSHPCIPTPTATSSRAPQYCAPRTPATLCARARSGIPAAGKGATALWRVRLPFAAATGGTRSSRSSRAGACRSCAGSGAGRGAFVLGGKRWVKPHSPAPGLGKKV